MRTIKLIIASGITCLVFFHSMAQAEEFRARIVKVQGEVYVLNAAGEKRKPQKKQFLVNHDETVVTDSKSRAVVQFNDGAMSVLDEKSSLRVEQSGWLSQLSGKVYYVFRKVFGKAKPKKVKTSFATIGIRGTTFIVDASAEAQQVALQEGKLNIESTGEDFEIPTETSTADDFARFKQQAREKQQALKKEFADYQKNVAQEFIEYKKSFDLEANKVVSFNGRRVNQRELDNNWQSSFDDYASFSREYIDAYRELDKSTHTK